MTVPPLRDHLAEAPGARLFLALWGGLATVDLARAGQAPDALQAALLATLAVGCAVGQRTGTALAAGAIVWLVTQGFVVHTGGSLTPAGGVELAWLAALLLATAAVARTTR